MSKIFLSYRREGGEIMATTLYRELMHRGFTVFYDIESLKSGPFDERLLRQIEESDDFLLILPEGSLDRCKNEGDWVRREIAHAIKLNKNIVPIMLRGFTFPTDLPEDIAEISRYNGILFENMTLFDARMDNLMTYLKGYKAANPQPKPTSKQDTPAVKKPKANTEKKQTLSIRNPFKEIFNLIMSLRTRQDGDIRNGVFSWYRGKYSYVSIPRGVISVAEGTFSLYNYNVNHLAIPDSLTVIDRRGAFSNLKNLKSVDLPYNLSYIGDAAFSNCASIKIIKLPESLTYIGDSAFMGCSSLKKIKLPDGLAYLGKNAFFGCESLSEMIIPDQITEISEGCFGNCSALKYISLPDGINSIGQSAFRNCRSLGAIDLPEGLESIGDYAFNGCQSLKSISIPSSVTKIGRNVFQGCKTITEINLPRGIKEIGHSAFDCCGNVLTRIKYDGSCAEWDSISKISIFGYNTRNCTIYCTDGTRKF